jgi:hypothetical protein
VNHPFLRFAMLTTITRKTGTELLSVPHSVLRTAQTVPKTISRKLADISVHGLLAVDLLFDNSPARAAWRAVLPAATDLFKAMPYTWEPALQALLPPFAKSLLENQQRKFLKDWNVVSQAFQGLDERSYLYRWLIVNTRTFYWTAPGTKRPRAPHDCMALNPFADYFNHADEGCSVQYGPVGFKIFAERVYEEGEEINISYGSHSNDFLLTEYGFILSENKWDEIRLDHIIISELSTKQRDQLEGIGFLGKYVLDKYTVCHRTQVAVRSFCVPLSKWHQFVNGEDDGEDDQVKADQVLLKLLKRYKEQATEASEQVASLEVGHFNQREMLDRRWKQIGVLLQAAINRIQKF